MDTPLEEQQQFHHVTCNIAAEEHEIVGEGVLSIAVLEQVNLFFHTFFIGTMPDSG